MALHLAAPVGLEPASAGGRTGGRCGLRPRSTGCCCCNRRVERFWIAVGVKAAKCNIALWLAPTVSLEAWSARGRAHWGVAVRVKTTLGDITLGLTSSVVLESWSAGRWAHRGVAIGVKPALLDVTLWLTPVVVLEPVAAGRRTYRGVAIGVEPTLLDVTLGFTPVVVLEPCAAGPGAGRGGGRGGGAAHWDVALPSVFVASGIADPGALGVEAGSRTTVACGRTVVLPLALVVGALVEPGEGVKAGLLRGHVAPPLDYRLGDLPGVGEGTGAHLLGDVGARFSRLELGHQFCDMLALLARFKRTLLLGLLRCDCLRKRYR